LSRGTNGNLTLKPDAQPRQGLKTHLGKHPLWVESGHSRAIILVKRLRCVASRNTVATNWFWF
jgi:hypothetical protein